MKMTSHTVLTCSISGISVQLLSRLYIIEYCRYCTDRSVNDECTLALVHAAYRQSVHLLWQLRNNIRIEDEDAYDRIEDGGAGPAVIDLTYK
jgi:hypothetical protein